MIHYVIIVCGVVTWLYFYLTRIFKYWEKRGVKTDNLLTSLSKSKDQYFGKKNVSQVANDLYRRFPAEKVVGYFESTVPVLLLRDPEIIKRICLADFNSFYARGMHESDNKYDNIELLRRNLVYVEGDIWRVLRQGQTPAFTSGKLRAMFPLIVERAERLQERTRALCAGGRPIDARDHMARYTTDFIGACGFGIDGDSLSNEKSAFRQLGKNIMHFGIKRRIILLLKTLFADTFKNVKIFGNVEKEFTDLISEILEKRNYKPSGRHDFIDLMLEIREKGQMECESMEKTKPDGTPEIVSMEMDDALIAAQVFIFFVAGFDTSSSATSYTLHEIAYNPEEQKKIQDNIDQVLAKHDNKLCYDAIKEMHYLEWAFKEGMRILPPIGRAGRRCRRKYKFEDLGFTVDEGTLLTISLQGLHHDPKFWDNPDKFRPERFSPEINEPKHKLAYLPFGTGPRACIGGRLGMMQSLAGLAAILSRFSVSPAPASVRQPVIDPRSYLVQNIRGGLPLIFTPRT